MGDVDIGTLRGNRDVERGKIVESLNNIFEKGQREPMLLSEKENIPFGIILSVVHFLSKGQSPLNRRVYNLFLEMKEVIDKFDSTDEEKNYFMGKILKKAVISVLSRNSNALIDQEINRPDEIFPEYQESASQPP